MSTIGQAPSTGGSGSTTINNITQVDPCGVNEFIHNIADYRLYFAHENQISNLTVNVNGDPATFENLVNSSDLGGGNIRFNSGNNGTFSKRANTVESISKFQEYFEIVSGPESNFDTIFIAISSSPVTANTAATSHRIAIRGNGFQVIDPTNTVVFTGGNEAGTYRVTRTLFGFEFSFNGTVVYATPESCVNYEGQQEADIAAAQAPVDTIAGLHIVSEHEEVVNIGAATPISTGHDFTQATGMTFKVFVRDQLADRGWDVAELDVDTMLAISGASTNDGFIHVFDNDFLTIDVIDAATGEITMSENGRDMEYVKSCLVAKLPQARIDSVINPDGSGYRDIGDVREQWGTYTGGDGGAVILPVPMGDDLYNVQLTGTAGTLSAPSDNGVRLAASELRTTTQFGVETNGTAFAFDWKVIGRKA